MEVEVDVVLHRLSLQLGSYFNRTQLGQVGAQVVSGEDEGESVAGVEIGEDVMQNFGVVDNELSALGRSAVKVDVWQCLVDLSYQDAAQLLDGGLFVCLDVVADALVFVEGDTLCDSGQQVEEEAEAERVKCQVLGSDVLGAYALEFDCASKDDQLMARGIVGLK